MLYIVAHRSFTAYYYGQILVIVSKTNGNIYTHRFAAPEIERINLAIFEEGGR